MSRQNKQKVQINKKKIQEDIDSLNIDELDDNDISSSEINNTYKKTQIRGKQTVATSNKNLNNNVKKKSIPKKGNIHDNKKQCIEEEYVDEDISEHESNDKDSSDISDIDDNQEISDAFGYDDKKEKSKKTKKDNEDNENNEDNNSNEDEMDEDFVQTVVMERVIKYIKLDDVIKEKQNEHKKEMKTLKDTKDQLEQFLIGFLDKINEEYIQLGNKSTLIKTETQTKAAPKMEDISVCLIDGFRKYEIYEDDDEIKRVVKDFIKTIDDKREIKTRKYLKRMNGDPDKKGPEKKESDPKQSPSNEKSIAQKSVQKNTRVKKATK
jgi:hypothetical protein